jgi:hypothetical protein
MASNTPTETRHAAPGDSLGGGRIANAQPNQPGPGTEREREGRQWTTGLRFLLAGGVLAAVGIALMTILGDGNQDGIGATLAIIACLPTVVGLALVGASITSKRSRKDQPFA